MGEGVAQDGSPEPTAPSRSAGWVARRLGVSTETLRTWHHRYEVGPSLRTSGGHRRYTDDDVARLEYMQELAITGVPVAEAARVARDGSAEARRPAADHVVRGRRPVRSSSTAVHDLAAAAMGMDQPQLAELMNAALRRHGVIRAWTDVAAPVLAGIGEYHGRVGDCIDVEHLLSEVLRGALSAIWTRPRSFLDVPPVLLASVEDDQHTLPLHALAAALAELRRPSRMLGAALPTSALVDAVDRTGPTAVFLWAQRPGTGHAAELRLIPRGQPHRRIITGGDGWDPDAVAAAEATHASTLQEAVELLGLRRDLVDQDRT